MRSAQRRAAPFTSGVSCGNKDQPARHEAAVRTKFFSWRKYQITEYYQIVAGRSFVTVLEVARGASKAASVAARAMLRPTDQADAPRPVR
jgi:hypothetical protein